MKHLSSLFLTLLIITVFILTGGLAGAGLAGAGGPKRANRPGQNVRCGSDE